MCKKKIPQRILGLLLAFAVSLAGCGKAGSAESQPVQGAGEDPAEVQETAEPKSTASNGTEDKKTETVYVNLDASGKPYGTTVSDWLHSGQPDVVFADRSDLENIQNIKGEQQPQRTGEDLQWQLEGNDLYYQGQSDKPLPLSVEITYRLDGQELEPQALAGRSGKLEMTLRFQNRMPHLANVQGQEETLYTPLMMVAVVMLPEEVFQNVQLSDGTLLDDGNRRMAALVTMPGLADSLDLEGYSMEQLRDLAPPETFTITADVTEFTMDTIMIAATPQLPDLEGLEKPEDFDGLHQDALDLKDLQSDLEEKLDPDRDIRSLMTDPERTRQAQVIVDDLFDFYDLNKDLLDILPKYVTDENIRLYDRIRYDLEDSTLDTLLDDEELEDLKDLMDDLKPRRLADLVDDYQALLDDEAMHDLFQEVLAFGLSDGGQGLLAQGAQALDALLDPANREAVDTLSKLLQAQNQLQPQLKQLLEALSQGNQAQLVGELAETSLRAMLLPDEDGYTELNSAQTHLLEEFGVDSELISAMRNPDNSQRKAQRMAELAAREEAAQEKTETEQAPVQPEDAVQEEPAPAEPTVPAEPSEDGNSTAPSNTEDSTSASSEPSAPTESDISQEQPNPDASDPSSGSEETSEPSAQEGLEVEVLSAEEELDPLATMSANEARMEILKTVTGQFDQTHQAQMLELIALENPQAAGLLKQLAELQSGLEQLGITPEQLSQALEFALGVGTPVLEAATQNPGQLQSLAQALQAENGQVAQRLRAFLPRLLTHLQENRENLDTLVLLLEELQSNDLLDQVENLDDLRDDLRDLKPIVQQLRRDLKRTDMNVSLHKSPETVDTLLRMKDDLENYRAVSETLRNLLQEEKVALSRKMIATLDRMEADGAADSAVAKLDDLDELLERKDLLQALSDDYRIFSDAPEGLETEVSFLFRTDEIDLPEAEPQQAPTEEPEVGFTAWLKGFLS